jgi:hypothetical protein
LEVILRFLNRVNFNIFVDFFRFPRDTDIVCVKHHLGGKFMNGLIGIIINILFAVFLFVDAPKHGKSQWLWAILGFLFGPIALGIYMIKTGRKVLGWILVVLVGLAYLFIIVMFVVMAVLFTNGGAM